MYGIIGGSGLPSLSILKAGIDRYQETPYGALSAPVKVGTVHSRTVLFLPRHGLAHSIPPHQINYKANLWALRELGARRIVSVASVGGIQERFSTGLLVMPHQIIDYTWGRPSSYFEGDAPVTHIDFTSPFSQSLRQGLIAAARRCEYECMDGGVYAVTQGPRLETAAEIDRIDRDGGNVVGMTGMPEAALARELGLEYAMIAVVVNHAAGRGNSRTGIQFGEMAAVTSAAMAKVESILEAAIST